MNLIRWISFGLAWLYVPVVFAQYSSTVFYMVAHQDDWQYFMGSNAWHDLKNQETKVESDLFLSYNATKTSYGCQTDYYPKGMEWCKRNYISRSETTPQTAPGKIDQPFFVVDNISGNPGYIALRVNLPAPDVISCFLYDITGNLFRIATDQQVESYGNYRFRLDHVPPGVYLVKIFSKSGLRTDAKIFMTN